VPVSALKSLGITPKIAELLIVATLWYPVYDDTAGPSWTFGDGVAGPSRSPRGPAATAVQFDQWEKWQITREQWEKGNADAAERARKSRQRRKQEQQGNVTRDASQNDRDADEPSANGSDSTVTRYASHSREEKRRESSVKGVSLGSSVSTTAPLESFPDHCDLHRHDPTPGPCGLCGDTRNRNREQDRRAADVESVKRVDAVQRERDRRAACWDCDSVDGTITMTDATGHEYVARCTHPAVP